jgi:hypothetical protein
MENLLKNDFTAHYGLPVSTVVNISVRTNTVYFEIEDDENREVVLHLTVGNGMAKYSNRLRQEVIIINYDKFITALPHAFQEGKKRCDTIVYTNENQQYFLLNELKDRIPKSKVRSGAKAQLLASLTLLMDVPTIHSFVNTFSVKRCCYFNKQSIAPIIINATNAFNRINSISTNGFKMSYPAVDVLGFEYYEYSGSQIFSL